MQRGFKCLTFNLTEKVMRCMNEWMEAVKKKHFNLIDYRSVVSFVWSSKECSPQVVN